MSDDTRGTIEKGAPARDHTTRDFALAIWLLYRGCPIRSVFAHGPEQSFTFEGVTSDDVLDYVNEKAVGSFARFYDCYRRVKQLLQDARMTESGRSDYPSRTASQRS